MKFNNSIILIKWSVIKLPMKLDDCTIFINMYAEVTSKYQGALYSMLHEIYT